MEVNLTPDLQAKLDQLSLETGRSRDEFVQDALAGYFEETLRLRQTLDGRYEDILNGKVKLIPGGEVLSRMRDITRRSSTG